MVEPAGWRFTGDYERDGGAPRPEASPTPPEEAGPELSGGLELLGTLGRGAFAVVHRARERLTGREVALKVLRGDRAGCPLSRARLQREGALAARLDHEGIVRVHAAGTFHGDPCLVMELVEGAPLAEVLGELPLQRRLELVRDAARGLGHAHERGVLHRDVKPENILVDARGRARVADFGLAAAEDLERLTRSGAVLGTPFYMAPEQLLGGRGVGPAADVWALGVILYQAAADRLPFQAESLTSLVTEILSGGLQGPRAHRPDLSPDLEAVCLRALCLDPAQRYPDGEALARDLDALLRGAPPPGARAPRRGPAPLTLLAAAAALAGAALLLGRGPTRSEAPPPRGGAGAGPLPRRRVDPLAQLEPLLRIGGPLRPRARALEAWLTAHRDHRRAEDARRALDAARGRTPLLVLRRPPGGIGAGRGLFLRSGELLVWQGLLLRLLDGEGRELRRWRPGLSVHAVAELPDGGLLLAGHEGSLLAVDPPAPELRPRYRARCPERVRALAVAPRRAVFAAACGDEVRLFDLAGGAERQRFAYGGRPVHALGFSPDERRLLVVCGEGEPAPQVHAYRVDERGECSQDWTRPGPPEGASALAFSPDGARLMMGTRAHQLLWVDPETGLEQGALRRAPEAGDGALALVAQVAHTVPVQAVLFSPDGARLHSIASRSSVPPGELRTWEVATGEQRGATLRLEDDVPRYLEVDSAGERLLIGCEEGEVLLQALPE